MTSSRPNSATVRATIASMLATSPQSASIAIARRLLPAASAAVRLRRGKVDIGRRDGRARPRPSPARSPARSRPRSRHQHDLVLQIRHRRSSQSSLRERSDEAILLPELRRLYMLRIPRNDRKEEPDVLANIPATQTVIEIRAARRAGGAGAGDPAGARAESGRSPDPRSPRPGSTAPIACSAWGAIRCRPGRRDIPGARMLGYGRQDSARACRNGVTATKSAP